MASQTPSGRSAMCHFLPLIAVTLISWAASPLSAQPTRGAYHDVRELPAGPIGDRIREVIETVNANDAGRVRKFFEESVAAEFRDFAPMEEHVAVFQQIYDQSHGLEFSAVRQYEEEAPEGETVVIVRNPLTDGWQALVLSIEPDRPTGSPGLGFMPARPPSDLVASAETDASRNVQQLDAMVNRLADADAFSGTVLLAKDGQVLYETARGLASKRFDVPNRIDTKFNLGSMNKMFTAVAIMQLVQRGELSLEDRLGQFLSTDWLPQEVSDKIQIKHLLTHTSGLGSYFNDRV